MDRLEGVSAAVLEPTTSMPLPSRDALTPTWTPPAAKPGVFLLAGGGTGGHLFPGVALAERIHERWPVARTLFVGSDRPIEQRIVSAQRLEHRTLSTTSFGHFRRRPDQFLWRNWQALRDAATLLQALRPEVVFGLGGFASAPVVWAAYRAGVPVMLLEQNAIPGKATCWLSRFARVVCTTFAESHDWLPRQIPTLVCGNPVRRAISDLAREPLPDHSGPGTILVLGGSLGADGLNTAMMDLVRRHPELRAWNIVHQTGPRQRDSVRHTYTELGQPAVVADFLDDLVPHYRAATIVISRAGATTLAELACVGRPVILVPFPHAADNHQQANAAAFAQQDAAVVVPQAAASPQTAEGLWRAMSPLLHDVARRRAMSAAIRELAHPDAADRILELIAGVAK